jgi:CheY-like chemotaxis protein
MATAMTRILLVEDDLRGIEAVREILKEYAASIQIFVASNRDDAIGLIEAEFFDLMILDLTIPADVANEHANPEYGFAVFGRAKDVAPGMPILLLTASTVESFVPAIIARTQQIDIWTNGKLGTVAVHAKLRIDTFQKVIAPYIQGANGLETVELDRANLQLPIEQQRLLRMFARRYQATRCEVRRVGGGLSGNDVFRVRLFNAQGGLVSHSIAKVGSIQAIQSETARYQQYVSLLKPDATPRLLVAIEFGAKATAAAFFGLTEGHASTLFQFAAQNHAATAEAVRGTARHLEPWTNAAQQGMRTVRDVRRRLVSDSLQSELLQNFPLPWAEAFEATAVQTKWGCVHGDCHGGNLLLTDAGLPAVIDYGDVDLGPLSLDPIALELSLLFHPDGPLVSGVWPDAATAAKWGDLDEYLVGCPNPEIIRVCREWARKVAAGDREIAASAYSYLLRQLKYQDTNKQRALSLLSGVKTLYDNT